MGYRNIKKQKKLIFLFKLRILIFQCPGTTRITNFTRMPLEHLPGAERLEHLTQVFVFLSHFHSWEDTEAFMRQLQMFQKVEYGGGPIFKVVLEC